MGLIVRKDLKNNLTATTNPTVNDDASNGYSKLSSWIVNDTTIYECADPTIGAAVWKDISSAGGGGGTGDVVGPTSSTDNAVVRFDTTTGKLIQDSNVIIDDLDEITGVDKLTVNNIVINDSDVESTGTSLNLKAGTRLRVFNDMSFSS